MFVLCSCHENLLSLNFSASLQFQKRTVAGVKEASFARDNKYSPTHKDGELTTPIIAPYIYHIPFPSLYTKYYCIYLVIVIHEEGK